MSAAHAAAPPDEAKGAGETPAPAPDGRLAEILDALPAGLAAYDRDGRLIHANPALWRQAGPGATPLPDGATLEQVVTLLAAAGHYGDGDPATRVRAGLALDRSRSRRRLARNAMGCWHELSSTPLPGGGTVSLSVDVTAVRRTESQAVERAALLEAILERLEGGVAEYDHGSRLRYHNAAYETLIGAAPGTLRRGMTIAEVVDLLDAAGQFVGLTESERAHLPREGLYGPRESERRRPDGMVVWSRSTPFPEGGHLVEVEDITSLRRAEEDVLRGAETTRAMLDNGTDGLALFDAAGRLIAANARAASMVGLSPAIMTPGRRLADLYAAQVAAGEFGPGSTGVTEVGEDMARPAERPEDRPRRYVRRRPDGSLLEVRTDPMPGGGTIRTYRDVTAEHRVRAELEAARDAAEAASRAKSRFLATVTHELRTPLNAVIGFSEAIAEETRPERMQGHAAEVLAAGRGLLALVDGILEAARAEAGEGVAEARPFDPAPVLRAAAAEAAVAAGEAGLTLSLDVPRRLPPVLGEQRGLRRVLDALLSNAVKFTPEGGTVTVAARVQDGGVVAQVADSGIGMRPEDVPRAMEAFVQLEAGLARRYPGSGLGLYLAKVLTGAMAMGLEFETAPGAGTTARVTMRPDAACGRTDGFGAGARRGPMTG